MIAWKAHARRVVMAVAPPSQRLPAEFRFQRRVGKLDAILERMDLGRRIAGRAIDVGANTGAYTYAFSRIFERVDAFEPQARCAENIVRYARRRPGVRVHEVGVSNVARPATLHVPVVVGRRRTHLASGLASLRPQTAFVRSHSVPIRLVTLDSYRFEDVATIKIDVEGHEFEVLEGARETIRRNRPLLIVEIEARHLPPGVDVGRIFGELAALGYRGWFLRAGAVEPLDAFRVERDQLPFVEIIARGGAAPGYVNNFVFEHRSAPPLRLFR